jgi:hypothetical protein
LARASGGALRYLNSDGFAFRFDAQYAQEGSTKQPMGWRPDDDDDDLLDESFLRGGLCLSMLLLAFAFHSGYMCCLSQPQPQCLAYLFNFFVFALTRMACSIASSCHLYDSFP